MDDPFSEYVDQKLVALLKPDVKTRANILVADDLRATLKILLRGYSVPYPVICSDPDEGILVRWSNDGCELELSFWAAQGWRELCFTDKETGENILIGSKASDPEGEKNALTVFSSLIHRLND